MITLTEKKLVIEIEDKNPQILLKMLQRGIIETIKQIDINENNVGELEYAHYFLLHLSKVLIEKTPK